MPPTTRVGTLRPLKSGSRALRQGIDAEGPSLLLDSFSKENQGTYLVFLVLSGPQKRPRLLKSFFPYLSHFKKASQIGANLMCIIADTSA